MSINKKSITLTECIILLVVIAVISGLALNNYFKAMEQTFEREALFHIAAAQKALDMGKAVNGKYPNVYLPDRESINSALNLQIPQSSYLSYRYIPTEGNYILEVMTARGWSLSYDSRRPKKGTYCSTGQCPTCPPDGKNCGN